MAFCSDTRACSAQSSVNTKRSRLVLQRKLDKHVLYYVLQATCTLHLLPHGDARRHKTPHLNHLHQRPLQSATTDRCGCSHEHVRPTGAQFHNSNKECTVGWRIELWICVVLCVLGCVDWLGSCHEHRSQTEWHTVW